MREKKTTTKKSVAKFDIPIGYYSEETKEGQYREIRRARPSHS